MLKQQLEHFLQAPFKALARGSTFFTRW